METKHTAGPDSWTMRETAHFNGGKEWFGYEHQCIQQPRLRRKDRYTRIDRSVTSTWSVDGEPCASFEEAIDRLDAAPSMTFDDLDAIGQFCSMVMAKGDFADFQAVRSALRSLDQKGLVWWERGKVRLLPDALHTAIGSMESNASGNPGWEAVSKRVNAARAAIARAGGAS